MELIMSPTTTTERPTLSEHPLYVSEVNTLSDLRNEHANCLARESNLIQEHTSIIHTPGKASRRRQIVQELPQVRDSIQDYSDKIREQEAVVKRTANNLQPELRAAYVNEHRELAIIVAEKLAELVAAADNLAHCEDEIQQAGVSLGGELRSACRLHIKQQVENYFSGDIYPECKAHWPVA